MSGRVRFTAEGALAWVTLSHPGRLGAMSRSMWRELRQVFLQLASEPQWRCVIVRGEEGAFCAGGDISEYPDFRFDPQSLRAFHEDDVWGALGAMLACDVPLIACIEGACMGAGMEIASCCDIRLAEPGARFGAPIGRLGFPMAPRESQLVARAAGELTAREMLLEAAVLDAQEMWRRGFLNAIAPTEELPALVRARAGRVLSLAPRAARMNKRLLRDPSAPAWDYAGDAEHREGITAFLEKRKPEF